MHIKTRGKRAMLYRSRWIKKGAAQGNTHGFSMQQFVGSLPVNAEAVPMDLASKLSDDELAFVHRTVVAPAQAVAEAERREVKRRAVDPIWRLEEAARYIREAAMLSVDAQVPIGRVKALVDALGDVKSFGGPPRQDSRREDPVGNALDCLRAAGRAVTTGYYSQAPAEGVRRSKLYADWLAIVREVEGSSSDGGLLRALQHAGWVKAKGH